MNSRSHEQTRCQRVPMAWKSAQDMSKDMLNSTNEISVNITMNGKALEEVTSFKYLGTGIAQWLERRTRD